MYGTLLDRGDGCPPADVNSPPFCAQGRKSSLEVNIRFTVYTAVPTAFYGPHLDLPRLARLSRTGN